MALCFWNPGDVISTLNLAYNYPLIFTNTDLQQSVGSEGAVTSQRGNEASYRLSNITWLTSFERSNEQPSPQHHVTLEKWCTNTVRPSASLLLNTRSILSTTKRRMPLLNVPVATRLEKPSADKITDRPTDVSFLQLLEPKAKTTVR